MIKEQLWGEVKLPCVEIEDSPRFKWRGLHLDVCRHFFDVDFVKQYIDWMALHKYNVFHWHLTEDQGWRIEIPGLPGLADISAWRTATGGCRYGGFTHKLKYVMLFDMRRKGT